ncbi:hypothetical protein DFH09DRAFT_1359303 [Mycena vulgaris]|nr:hypothetical protein DFH09DRAFT_1359303 [Mycena vulgaris]
MVSMDLEELLQYAKRVEGKTVVLTGGPNGIGRETAILFARYGAKVVIGDVNGEAASKVVKEIRELGGNAIYVQCNVLQWEDQIALFESAVSHFGSVDVVVRAWFYPQGPSRLTISSLQIPCAGVSEHGDACSGVLDYKDGKPLPPDMSTLEMRVHFLACKSGLRPRRLACFGRGRGITRPRPAFRLASHFVGLASHFDQSGLRSLHVM